jgi:hypothetical protein
MSGMADRVTLVLHWVGRGVFGLAVAATTAFFGVAVSMKRYDPWPQRVPDARPIYAKANSYQLEFGVHERRERTVLPGDVGIPTLSQGEIADGYKVVRRWVVDLPDGRAVEIQKDGQAGATMEALLWWERIGFVQEMERFALYKAGFLVFAAGAAVFGFTRAVRWITVGRV